MPILLSQLYSFPLYSFDLSAVALANGSNSSTLKAIINAANLNLARSGTAGGCVQTSASAIVTSGIVADDPRFGNAGYGPGLVVEETRTLGTPTGPIDLSGWSLGNAVVALPTDQGTLSAGPNGSTNARRYSIPAVSGASAISCFYAGIAGTNANYTMSVWLQANTGASSIYAMTVKSGGTNYTKQLCSLTTTWQRVAITAAFTSGSNWFMQMGADLRDVTQSATSAAVVNAAAAAFELGSFATEFIATGTRSGERFWHSAPAQLLSGGRLGLALKFIPKCSIGGSNDNSTDPYVWMIDANNKVTLNKTTGVATVTIGGSAYTTASGFTWNRGDAVDLWIEAGGGNLNTVVKARKNNGSATTLGVSGAAQSSISTPSTIDLLCNGTSGQLNAWSQKVEAYATGTRVPWAA